MTERERWTVYPLLFMTLGIAVKDRITNLSNVDTVLCSTLVVHDRRGQQQVVITSTPAGGLLRTQGRDGLGVVVGHAENLAGLMFVSPGGKVEPTPASVRIVAPQRPARRGQAPPEQSPPEAKAPQAPERAAPDDDAETIPAAPSPVAAPGP